MAFSAQAGRCPVTCQYVSKQGVPVAGCAQDEGSAFGKLFKNCLDSAKEVFDQIDYSNIDPAVKAEMQLKSVSLRLDMCVMDTSKGNAFCRDNAAADAERRLKLATECHMVKAVGIFGYPLYVSETGCEEYAPKY